jgi:hypothetical protein
VKTMVRWLRWSRAHSSRWARVRAATGRPSCGPYDGAGPTLHDAEVYLYMMFRYGAPGHREQDKCPPSPQQEKHNALRSNEKD